MHGNRGSRRREEPARLLTRHDGIIDGKKVSNELTPGSTSDVHPFACNNLSSFLGGKKTNGLPTTFGRSFRCRSGNTHFLPWPRNPEDHFPSLLPPPPPLPPHAESSGQPQPLPPSTATTAVAATLTSNYGSSSRRSACYCLPDNSHPPSVK